MTVNEAVLSSRMEGTEVSLEAVLQQDAGIEPADVERRHDIQEIANYRYVLRMAEQEMEHRRLSLSFVRSAHQILLRGVRGEGKRPGEFRTDQNWIGMRNTPIEHARFVSPDPFILLQALDAWAEYVDSDCDDPIVQTAVVHAQFEILHPFRDGNGRIGRLLIPLVLFQRATLSRPMFYMSECLERKDSEYRDRLLAISDVNDWQGWVEFFANAVEDQANGNLSKTRKILDLYNMLKQGFLDTTHSQYAVPVLDAFFASPVIRASEVQRVAGVSTRFTANSLLKQLTDARLIIRLRESSGRRPAVYALPDLIRIVEGREVV